MRLIAQGGRRGEQNVAKDGYTCKHCTMHKGIITVISGVNRVANCPFHIVDNSKMLRTLHFIN